MSQYHHHLFLTLFILLISPFHSFFLLLNQGREGEEIVRNRERKSEKLRGREEERGRGSEYLLFCEGEESELICMLNEGSSNPICWILTFQLAFHLSLTLLLSLTHSLTLTHSLFSNLHSSTFSLSLSVELKLSVPSKEWKKCCW